jgi:DNA-binding MarR family transcriptional regulator
VQIALDLGLAPQQAGALRALTEPVPMRDLAEALHCDSSNVTGIVDRLEERGLVRREVSPDDRRVKMLVLTEEGDRLRRAITSRFAEPPPQLASLSRRDQTTLRDIMRRALAQDDRAGGDAVT